MGAAPACSRAGCPGAADGEGWVLVRGKRGNQSGIAPEVQQEGGVRVRSSTWLIDDVGDLHPRVGFAARVVLGGGARGEVRLQLSGAQVR